MYERARLCVFKYAAAAAVKANTKNPNGKHIYRCVYRIFPSSSSLPFYDYYRVYMVVYAIKRRRRRWRQWRWQRRISSSLQSSYVCCSFYLLNYVRELCVDAIRKIVSFGIREENERHQQKRARDEQNILSTQPTTLSIYPVGLNLKHTLASD